MCDTTLHRVPSRGNLSSCQIRRYQILQTIAAIVGSLNDLPGSRGGVGGYIDDVADGADAADDDGVDVDDYGK